MTIEEEFAAYKEQVSRHPNAFTLTVFTREEIHECFFDGGIRFKAVYFNDGDRAFKRYEPHLTAH